MNIPGSFKMDFLKKLSQTVLNKHEITLFLLCVCFHHRIYDWMPEQPNIFQVEQLERLKLELPELKNCLCPTVSHFIPSSFCVEPDIHVDANGIDSVENA